jgi:hypothetical protein
MTFPIVRCPQEGREGEFIPKGSCKEHHPIYRRGEYTARQLVSRSWYLSGIVARRLQSVVGDQAVDGLFLLNSLLDWKAIQIDLIPYWTYYEFMADIGRETYFIPNLYAVELLTFNIGPVRYPMSFTPRTQYFGAGRIDNINSLPFNWYFNRSLGGGSIYMYFKPQGRYPIKLMGKFGLQDVDLDTNMLRVYDPAYLEYLRYALAQYMCSEYGILFNPESAKILMSLGRTLMDVSPPDLSVKKRSILTSIPGLNWGDVNIGRGYRP